MAMKNDDEINKEQRARKSCVYVHFYVFIFFFIRCFAMLYNSCCARVVLRHHLTLDAEANDPWNWRSSVTDFVILKVCRSATWTWTCCDDHRKATTKHKKIINKRQNFCFVCRYKLYVSTTPAEEVERNEILKITLNHCRLTWNMYTEKKKTRGWKRVISKFITIPSKLKLLFVL